MAFQGDLGDINLASVFQNLLQNRLTGTLILRRGKEERFICFRGGLITMFSEGAGTETPLAGLLVRLGVVEKGEMDKALRRRRGRTSLTEVLSKMGLAKEVEIFRAIRTFVAEEMYDLFTWEDGAFEFQEGTVVEGIFDPDIAAADLEIDVTEIILEAARRQDDWERISRHLGSQKDIYILRKEREEDAKELSDEMVAQILPYLDGRRTVEAVIRESGLGRFRVSSALADLIAERFVRQLSVAELQKEARSAVKERRYEDADALLDRALEIEHGNVSAHRMSGDVKEKLENLEGAAQEHKMAAGLLIETGNASKAADCLRDAVRLQPHDLTARERLYHLLKGMNRRKDARTVAVEAAGFCIRMGVHDRAASLLEDTIEALGADEETERMLVEVYVGQGKIDKAVDIYQERAEGAIEKGDYPGAVHSYEEILKLNPSNEEARKRIAEINSGTLERRRRRRKYIFRGIVLVVVISAIVGWQVLESTGRRALKELMPKVEEELLEGNYSAARGTLLKFQGGRFGWTRAADEAKNILRAMQMMRAQKTFEEAERLRLEGKVQEALEKYREVYRMNCPASFQKKVEQRLSE